MDKVKVKDKEGKTKEVNVFFTEKSTGGRPPKALTPEALQLVTALSRFQATDEEIAGALGCCRDVFYTEVNREVYRQAKEKGQAEGNVSLRRKQFEKAMSGDWHMLQWCGIQLLHQSNKVDVQANVSKDEQYELMERYINGTKGTIAGDNRSQV